MLTRGAITTCGGGKGQPGWIGSGWEPVPTAVYPSTVPFPARWNFTISVSPQYQVTHAFGRPSSMGGLGAQKERKKERQREREREQSRESTKREGRERWREGRQKEEDLLLASREWGNKVPYIIP